MSPLFWDIFIPIIVTIIKSETKESVIILAIPILRSADVHAVRVDTTSFWKITSETIGEVFRVSEIGDKSSILYVEISKDEGNMSAVTKSKSRGSFLFCSL